MEKPSPQYKQSALAASSNYLQKGASQNPDAIKYTGKPAAMVHTPVSDDLECRNRPNTNKNRMR